MLLHDAIIPTFHLKRRNGLSEGHRLAPGDDADDKLATAVVGMRNASGCLEVRRILEKLSYQLRPMAA